MLLGYLLSNANHMTFFINLLYFVYKLPFIDMVSYVFQMWVYTGFYLNYSVRNILLLIMFRDAIC